MICHKSESEPVQQKTIDNEGHFFSEEQDIEKRHVTEIYRIILLRFFYIINVVAIGLLYFVEVDECFRQKSRRLAEPRG